MKKEDISIVTFLWNESKYLNKLGKDYVRKLYNGIKNNTTLPFQFFLFYQFTGRRFDKVYNLPFDIKFIPIITTWRRNLNKINVYNKYETLLTGQIFLFDLDVIICNNIDDILSYDGKFGIINDIFDGSIVSFKRSEEIYQQLYRPMICNFKNIGQRTKGSEKRYYREKLKDPDILNKLYPDKIISYKKEYPLHKEKDKIKIVYFHGRPRPHELTYIPWIYDKWGKI